MLIKAETRNSPEIDNTIPCKLLLNLLMSNILILLALLCRLLKAHLKLSLDNGSSDHKGDTGETNKRHFPAVIEADYYSCDERTGGFELNCDSFCGCSVHDLGVGCKGRGKRAWGVGSDVEPALVF